MTFSKSNSFDNTGKMAIGLYSSFPFGLSTLGIGLIRDIFQTSGNIFSWMQEFMCVRGEIQALAVIA